MAPIQSNEELVQTLAGLKNLSWLSNDQLRQIALLFTVTTFERRAIISEGNLSAMEGIHVLLSGVARITYRNRKGVRVVVAMVAPGTIPAFPQTVPGLSYNFRMEAVSNCSIGVISLRHFIKIALGISSDNFKRAADICFGGWHKVQLRSANFGGHPLDKRVALALLELSEDFGISDKRGTFITIRLRHRDVADLVGASRPRVTEILSAFERDRLVIPDNHHLIVRRDRLQELIVRGNSVN
jgi:CRP-like cAMP-binding protein